MLEKLALLDEFERLLSLAPMMIPMCPPTAFTAEHIAPGVELVLFQPAFLNPVITEITANVLEPKVLPNVGLRTYSFTAQAQAKRPLLVAAGL
jgi:hypothetical protein